MKSWQQWNRYDWSEALLASYFGIRGEESGPVRILLVTDDRLCQVAGATIDAAEDVRQSLITKTVRSVGNDNFWRHAADHVGERPDYLAYLVVACIAAIDKADVDERSFLRRLDEMTGVSASQSIDLMAKLWERLQRWLAQHPDEYRQLVLPDPGGWTRIGYTTRLAFPSRPDQNKLRGVLSHDDVQDDPPLSVVIRALEGSRSVFSKRFVAELDDFEAAVRRGASAAELFGSSLWSAVIAATALEAHPDGDERRRWTVLGVDDGYEIDLRLATAGHVAPDGYALVDGDDFGEWERELVTNEGQSALPDLLAGSLPTLGNIHALAKGGLIPMVEASHGALEVATKRDLEFSTLALVSDALADDVQARFGGTRTPLRDASGWCVIRSARLTTAPAETFEGTTLGRCWVLHDTPFPPSLRLVGGIRVGDAYLGHVTALPRVRAVGADSVSCQIDGTAHDLQEVAGYWSFPAIGLVPGDAEVVIRASFPDGELVRRVRFVSAPSIESFKGLGDPAAWQVEGSARAGSLQATEEFYVTNLGEAVADADVTVRLGRDVGVFVSTRADATWEIAAFGRTRTGRLLRPTSSATPQGRSGSDGQRRRWRQQLGAARLDDDAARSIARSILSNGRSDEQLPVVDAALGTAPDSVTSGDMSPQGRAVTELVERCVAVANRRAGLEPTTWRRLAQETLGLDRPTFDCVSRAWSEAHLVDEVVSRRWSTRRVMFVRPFLSAFKTERWIGASLEGLALPTTHARLRATAAADGILIAEVRSRSGLIPDGLAFRCDSIETLRRLAQSAQLSIRYLRADPFYDLAGRDLTTESPGGYERSSYTSHYPVLDGIEMTRWWKGGAPGFWTVASRRHFTWTHFEAAAVFWAMAFAGRTVVSHVGSGALRSEVSYLPLSAARWLNTVSPIRSGPDPAQGGAHCYTAPTEALAVSFATQLAGFVERRLSALEITGRD